MEIFAAVTLLLILAALLTAWYLSNKRDAGREQIDRADAALEQRPQATTAVGGTDRGPVSLVGPDGQPAFLEVLGRDPEHSSSGMALAPGVSSEILSEASKFLPMVSDLADGQVYRLVGGPAEELAKVAGKPDLYRGFALGPDGISGHGEFAKVGSQALSPAVALTVASAVLGCYWQQQIDEKLGKMDAKLTSILDHLHTDYEAALQAAEDELRISSRLPLGAHLRHLPPAWHEARKIMHAEHRHVEAAKDEAERLVGKHRSVVAHVYRDFIRKHELREHISRYFRALRIDLRVARLQLMSAEHAGLSDFGAAVAQLARERLDQLDDVRSVVESLATVKLTSERKGVGEKTMRWTHDDRAARRMETAEQLRAWMRSAEAEIQAAHSSVPKPEWARNPYAITLEAGGREGPTGYIQPGLPSGAASASG